MRYGSVCSGIEAATVAWHSLGWTPAFFSEIEANPSYVLAHHYGSNMPGQPLTTNGVPNYGDFTQIEDTGQSIDLLVGGTPCQSFSVAGKRLGLDDPRGNLALEFLALAKRLRPKWIIWENVPGVFSSYSGSEHATREIGEGCVGGHRECPENRDFAMFLAYVRECGYGFAYRVLDAQYVRVDGLERAVPQRRRRVILVGCLGDWASAAAVLLEPEGMSGDIAPSRSQGEGPHRGFETGPSGGSITEVAPTLDSGCKNGPIRSQIGCGVLSNPIGGFQDGSVSGPVLSKWSKGSGGPAGDELQNMVAYSLSGHAEYKEGLTTLSSEGGDCGGGSESIIAVSHTFRGEGHDASCDGTGKGTPIVPLCSDTKVSEVVNSADGAAFALRAMGRANGKDNGGGQLGVAFAQNSRDKVRLLNGDGQIAGAPGADEGLKQQTLIASIWAVRRLMPIECERLQGFPDGYTHVPSKGGKLLADGPRYKALGNSMAVNVMRWVGQRIQMVEDATKQ